MAEQTCARCEQEGTCSQHVIFMSPHKARQLRRRIRADQPQAIASYTPPPRELTTEEVRWSLRGEPRTRATFSQPHPGDFPGGLPDPPEYPAPAP